MKILLVEDSPSDVVLTLATLSSIPGTDVTTVGTLADAIASLQRGVFDLVLTDLGLPDSFGLGTAHALYPHLSDGTALVVLTGTGTEALGLQALRSGSQDFLDKTHLGNTELLRRCMAYAVERRRHLSEILGLRRNLADIRRQFDAQNADALKDLTVGKGDAAAPSVADLEAGSLQRRAPERFELLRDQYGALVARGVAVRLTQRHDDLRKEMSALARALGMLGADARDVVKLHTTALESQLSGVESARKMEQITGEARLRLLELMGQLSNYYRQQAAASPEVEKSNPA